VSYTQVTFLISADSPQLDDLNSDQIAILTNPELLAFSQDSEIGTPAMPFKASASMRATSPPEFYAGQSSKGTHVFIVNLDSDTAEKTFDFANVPDLGRGNFKVHDMWSGENVAGVFTSTSTFNVTLAPHDTAAYLITQV
jgi:alpha-galactosidase